MWERGVRKRRSVCEREREREERERERDGKERIRLVLSCYTVIISFWFSLSTVSFKLGFTVQGKRESLTRTATRRWLSALLACSSSLLLLGRRTELSEGETKVEEEEWEERRERSWDVCCEHGKVNKGLWLFIKFMLILCTSKHLQIHIIHVLYRMCVLYPITYTHTQTHTHTHTH